MAHDKYFEYRNIIRALGFAAGVEYANDGALSVQGVFRVPGPKGKQVVEETHYVHVRDDDGDKSDGDPTPKRWSKRQALEVGDE